MDYDFFQGKGEFIFFLHGWGGDKNSFKIVKNHIAKNCNMVFVSFAGFGDSLMPNKPYTVSDYANEVKNLIVSLARGRKVNIVCHSFGARVTAKLASLYSELIDKIIIVDGAGVKPRRKLSYYIKVLKYKRAKARVRKGKASENILQKYGSSDYKALSPVMKQTFTLVVNENLKKDFKQIKNETLLFWGEKDKDTPLYMAKKLNRWIKNSALVVAKNAGHFSYIDDLPLFIAVINSFFFS